MPASSAIAAVQVTASATLSVMPTETVSLTPGGTPVLPPTETVSVTPMRTVCFSIDTGQPNERSTQTLCQLVSSSRGMLPGQQTGMTCFRLQPTGLGVTAKPSSGSQSSGEEIVCFVVYTVSG